MQTLQAKRFTEARAFLIQPFDGDDDYDDDDDDDVDVDNGHDDGKDERCDDCQCLLIPHPILQAAASP